MGYLLYVAHDAENLQFYLWFQDYSRRFFAASRAEQALSPLWNDDAAQAVGNDPGPRTPDRKPGLAAEFAFGFDECDVSLESMNDQHSFISAGDPAYPVGVANAQKGLQWQSCEPSNATLEIP